MCFLFPPDWPLFREKHSLTILQHVHTWLISLIRYLHTQTHREGNMTWKPKVVEVCFRGFSFSLRNRFRLLGRSTLSFNFFRGGRVETIIWNWQCTFQYPPWWLAWTCLEHVMFEFGNDSFLEYVSNWLQPSQRNHQNIRNHLILGRNQWMARSG